MLTMPHRIAAMLELAAESFVEATAAESADVARRAGKPDDALSETDVWDVIDSLIPDGDADIPALPTCAADLEMLGTELAPVEVAPYYDAIALYADDYSASAPTAADELDMLRAARALRLAARMLLGTTPQPGPEHARALLGVTAGPRTREEARLVDDFGGLS